MAEGTMAIGMWCHVEIPAKDPEKNAKFYGALFDWKFQAFPMGEGVYHMYETGKGGIGGGVFDPPEGVPRQIINYVNVEDIERTAALAEKNGGKVVVPTQEVPGFGWFSLIADPEGNVFGIWKQNPHPAAG